MARHGVPAASADVRINADPEVVYGLITDLSTLAELAEETTAMRWTKGDAARTGAQFKGDNRNGGHTWTTMCTVTEASPDCPAPPPRSYRPCKRGTPARHRRPDWV
jgi:hypothetical protein